MTSTVSIGVFHPEEARQIKRKVLGTDKQTKSPFDYKDRNKLGWHYGILKEVLSPATNPLTGYTQATCAVLMYLEAVDTLDMEEVEGENNYLTITNRSPFISGEVGDVVLVRWIVKEWAPIWAAGTSLRHGIVRADLGCGYYTIELGIWAGEINTAGSGIGSDPSVGADTNCDVCYDITGEGTNSCGVTISYPPCPVTGIGQFVTAYHRASVLVPLKTDSACLLTGTGSEPTSSSNATSSNSEAIWHIVDGLQVHTAQYKEVWDCCEATNGPETLISRIPIIFAGKECASISCGECPEVTSS